MEIRRLVKSGVAFPEAIESVAQVTEEVLREYLAPVTVGELDDITPRIQAAVNAVYWKFDEPFVHAVTEFAADVLMALDEKGVSYGGQEGHMTALLRKITARIPIERMRRKCQELIETKEDMQKDLKLYFRRMKELASSFDLSLIHI